MKKLLFFVAMFCSIAMTAKAATETCDCGTTAKITATAKEGYHFVQWSDGNTEKERVVTVSANAHYTAIFAPNIYKITFTDYLGNAIPGAGGDYAYGTLIEYKGGFPPTKPATAQYTYEFTGWNPTIVDRLVTKDESFAPVFKEILRKYKIYYRNYDNTLLQDDEFEYGATPKYKGLSKPTKPATVQYKYTFKGWTPKEEPVTGEKTYVAQYDSTEILYGVTFVDEWKDTKTILRRDSLPYGAMPTEPTKPTSKQDHQYVYTCSGWTPEITTVTGDITYTAKYSTTPRKYLVTFIDHDGTPLRQDSIAYGAMPTEPAKPTRAQDDSLTYTFDKWTPEVVKVNGDIVYQATYKATKRTFTVTVKVDDAEHGTVTGAGTYEYGETVTVIATPDGCYNFSKWSNGETSAEYTFTVTDDVDLTATFDIKKFKITVDSADNTMGTVTIEKL